MVGAGWGGEAGHSWEHRQEKAGSGAPSTLRGPPSLVPAQTLLAFPVSLSYP